MKAVVESRSVEEENWKVVEDLEGYDGKGRRGSSKVVLDKSIEVGMDGLCGMEGAGDS